MAKVINAVLRLRRDNDYNYEKVGNSFIPAFGEVCLVDTARSGLRVRVGDGKSNYNNLEYADDIFIKAYFNKEDEKFYKDAEFSELLSGNTNRIYIDLNNGNTIYYFNGEQYVVVGAGILPTASATIAGVMKLYNVTGDNVDGTMTQKAITDELNQKFEMKVNQDDESLIFANNL